MIKFNEQSISPSRISTSIKHRCKINSYYYYIQIYVDSIANSEKITFLIKSKKENERKTILFKRNFYYDELLNYNKYFKSFSSLEEIFINIAQCIEEKKYGINNSIKCLSLILRIYISKLRKYVNISINLNEHKNLRPLSMINNKQKEIKKIMLGIQNDEELSYAIYDIRQRLKNLEQNQTIMNNNNINIYRNNDINNVKNNCKQYINNSTLNDISNVFNNTNNNINKNDINYYNKNNINRANTTCIKNNNNNIFQKNITLNQNHRISGVNELIKKINVLESTLNSKDNKNKNLNTIDSNLDKNQYIPKPEKKKGHYKYNKSVDDNKRNNIPYNLNANNISNTMNVEKNNNLQLIFNKEKSMNGSKIIGNNNIDNHTDYKHENKNKNEINDNNYIKKFIYKNNNSTINFFDGDNDNDKKFSLGSKKDSNIKINNKKEKEQIIQQKNDAIFYNNNINDYDNDDNGYLQKTKTNIDKKVKNKQKNINKSKTLKNKNNSIYNNDNNINNNYIINNNINNNNQEENGFSNNQKYINNNKEDESEEVKEKKNVKKLINKNNIKENLPKKKIKNFSNIIKDNQDSLDNNYNPSINSLTSKPIIKQNTNRSISSSKSNMTLKSPKKVPIFSPEKLTKYIQSNIVFRKVELNLLKNKLSKNNNKTQVNFDLLYRATRDGDNDIIIKKMSLGYENVLTLFYTNEGARFGIFIKRKKNRHIKAKDRGEKIGTSFIVGLNNLVIYDIYKNKCGKGDYNKVLCFGCCDDKCTNGTKWMIYTPQNEFLNKKCVMGSGVGLFKDIDIEQIVGPSEYTIKDVEIFNVIVEQNYDDEDDDNDDEEN